MKNRKWIVCIFAVAALALVAVVGYTIFGDDTLQMADVPPIEKSDARDRITAWINVDEDLSGFSGIQTIEATNRTGLDQTQIVLPLYANVYGWEDVITLHSATIDGKQAAISLDDDHLIATIAHDWSDGEMIELVFSFDVSLPEAQGFVGSYDGAQMAVGALPTLAVWEGDAWDTDVHWLSEPSYAQAFDYELRVNAPASVEAAFGGALVSSYFDVSTDWLVHTVRMQGARDMSFSLRKNGAQRQREIGGALVTATAESGSAANALLDRAQEAMDALAQLGFAYPFPTLAIVQADTGFEDGLIGSGLIAVSGEGDKEAQRQTITRLIARQTLGVLVESDPFETPWLSRSLASAVELMAYRRIKGEDAYEARYFDEIEVSTRLTRPFGVTIGATVEHFGGDAEMSQVLRDQGAAMLMGVEQAVGEDAFLDALTWYVEQCAGKIATQGDLEDALYEATGSRWDGYLSDMLAS